uniref:Phage tail-collar fibre protein n=1 Tax=Candidatus Kentrum sp. FM TaxID=2126340 RepID=A0A450RX72_9GAMM|nr:MAG: Phage tail-collar fibre protein [Candidatus Kentron sp. FM]VFJ43713.1 MAG: Phage tail-collar fibre protein [Candidatus Kentron sp. FM]VFK05695.1 MAG: Phage tail-collar fibre protein [Candidatus Kentron sp. FM]
MSEPDQLTTAGLAYLATKTAAMEPVVLDRVVLAQIDGIDGTTPVDPAEGMPDAGQITWDGTPHGIGKDGDDKVYISVRLESDVGDFDFNRLCVVADDGTVVGISNLPLQCKRKDDQTIPQSGNTIIHSFLVRFTNVAGHMSVTVDAAAWQMDYLSDIQGLRTDLDAHTGDTSQHGNNHTHAEYLPTDHIDQGAQPDPHGQYLTEGRGDARYYTQAQVDAMVDGATLDVKFHYGSTPPDNWFEIDGTEFDRDQENAIWTEAQTRGLVVTESEWQAGENGKFSDGDGSTTFRLPDWRGRYPRGWDHGAGRVSDVASRAGGDTVGSTGEDALQQHRHLMKDTWVDSIYNGNDGNAPTVIEAGANNDLDGTRIGYESGSISPSLDARVSDETTVKDVFIMWCIHR